jgi:photosystem II stability/assembly factor-like uncharacterized protein
MLFTKRFLLPALTAALFLQHGTIQAAEYVDVLDAPAVMSQLAIKSPLNTVVTAGTRLVTVGIRGHILFSDDAGKTWQQAKVPVSSDLTSVYFPTPTDGWAVGHDGVVLHTADAGESWTKQLDGMQAGKLMLEYYTKMAANDPANERLDSLVYEAERVVDEGADKPFLGVWFSDNLNGYVVGAFGLIFQTKDGGASWFPLNDKIDNPQGYHLNAISGTGSGQDVIMVSEQGLVMRMDPATGMFVTSTTPFEGTYFGMQRIPSGLVIYGLSGMAFKSTDGGASWTQLIVPVDKPFTAAATTASGLFFLFDQPGDMLNSIDGGQTFRQLPQPGMLPISSAVAVGNETLVLVGPRGVRVLPIE